MLVAARLDVRGASRAGVLGFVVASASVSVSLTLPHLSAERIRPFHRNEKVRRHCCVLRRAACCGQVTLDEGSVRGFFY
jgi:hypothetical protein